MEIEIVKFVQNFASAFNDALFLIFTKFGEEIFFFSAFFILWWCVGKSASVKLLITYFVSVGFNTILKSLVARPRPYVASEEIINKLPANGSSFPSGHSQSYANVSGFLTFFNLNKIKSKWAKVLIILFVVLFGVFAVGLSRLYFGQHYLTDVIAGLAFGFFISFAMVKLFQFLETKIKFTKKINKILSVVVVASVLVCDLVVLLTNLLNEKYSLKVMAFSGFILAMVLSFLLDKNTKEQSESVNLKTLKVVLGLGFTCGLYCLLNLFLKQVLVLELIKFFIVFVFALLLFPILFKIVVEKLKENKMKIVNNKYISKSPKQTEKFAKMFAKTIKNEEIILLSGDLGAGKTTFTKFLLKALKVKEPVTSPTFTIMREYAGKKHAFYHFDMYRIESLEELEEIGFNEYVNGSKENSVVLIEWWENIKNAIPNGCTHIKINKINDFTREFIITKNYVKED